VPPKWRAPSPTRRSSRPRSLVCKSGVAAAFSEQELKQKLDAPDCEIRVAVKGKGKGEARFWTCDLTEGYIRINGSYRT
jgi:glutamate N-acetyltransferase/amino-acid N-acetyltransferase